MLRLGLDPGRLGAGTVVRQDGDRWRVLKVHIWNYSWDEKNPKTHHEVLLPIYNEIKQFIIEAMDLRDPEDEAVVINIESPDEFAPSNIQSFSKLHQLIGATKIAALEIAAKFSFVSVQGVAPIKVKKAVLRAEDIRSDKYGLAGKMNKEKMVVRVRALGLWDNHFNWKKEVKPKARRNGKPVPNDLATTVSDAFSIAITGA